MTRFSIERFSFDETTIRMWGALDRRHRNWPVVYVMTGAEHVYVGESRNAESRMLQHRESPEKTESLSCVRVVLDDTFNKSVCLDLESYLIGLFSGDGALAVLNGNAGITDADYYRRSEYRRTFDAIFEELRAREHLFQRTLPEIINSDLFKFSPFKALNHDQAAAVEDILDGLFTDIESGTKSTIIVSGGPGTGKTVVAIYLLKLLADIRRHGGADAPDDDSMFADFFTEGYPELIRDRRIGLVVPQQSLRRSVSNVFSRIPGLSKGDVLTPFEVGKSPDRFDVLIVDEAHRLNQRAAQAAGPLNNQFADINRRFFGVDDMSITQLDWIRKQAHHVILLLDEGQSVRPADLSPEVIEEVRATANSRTYHLASQMRVRAGEDYIGYVRDLLGDHPPAVRQGFADYDLRLFDNITAMRREIEHRDREHGLARMVAGYAWEWVSKKDRELFDIEIDGEKFRWNSVDRDWISSPKSIDEMGSIHTVQGYDLNYAGVVIGPDIAIDPETGRVVFRREHYKDKKGRANNRMRGIVYTDHDILRYVQNIYAVLLTRAIQGTYVYVCDPLLRERFSRFC